VIRIARALAARKVPRLKIATVVMNASAVRVLARRKRRKNAAAAAVRRRRRAVMTRRKSAVRRSAAALANADALA